MKILRIICLPFETVGEQSGFSLSKGRLILRSPPEDI